MLLRSVGGGMLYFPGQTVGSGSPVKLANDPFSKSTHGIWLGPPPKGKPSAAERHLLDMVATAPLPRPSLGGARDPASPTRYDAHDAGRGRTPPVSSSPYGTGTLTAGVAGRRGGGKPLRGRGTSASANAIYGQPSLTLQRPSQRLASSRPVVRYPQNFPTPAPPPRQTRRPRTGAGSRPVPSGTSSSWAAGLPPTNFLQPSAPAAGGGGAAKASGLLTGGGGGAGGAASSVGAHASGLQSAMDELDELKGLVKSDSRDAWRFEQAQRRPTTAPYGGRPPPAAGAAE